MENKPVEKKSPAGKKSNVLTILLLLLFLGAGGIAGYFFQETEKLKEELINCEKSSDKITTEKARVMAELEDMLIKYDTLSSNNEGLSTELLEQKEKVEEMLKKAKAQNWTISKLKKETATLRSIMKEYVQTIDSLNTLTINLREENTEITKELGNEMSKNKALSKEKKDLAKTVKIGQRLEAIDISVLAQRVKSNNVHRETTRASKTDKIKVCFTLDKNEIAKKGTRIIYVRILAPDATIMEDESGAGKFKFSGGSGFYSLKREVEYDNAEADFCFYYDVKGGYPPVGSYICEIYEGENLIGTANLTLK